MTQIGIAQLNKNPSMIDSFDGAVEIINRKTKEIKGIFIPIQYRDMIQKALDEIEYQKFIRNNASLITNQSNADETLLDGLQDEY